MLEPGGPFSVSGDNHGMESIYAVRVARRYGHIEQTAQSQAIRALSLVGIQDDGAQNWAQSQTPQLRQLAN